MIMYFISTGEHPIGNNKEEVMAAISAKCTRPKYSHLDNTYFLMTSAMALDPAERPSTEDCLK